MKTIPIYQHPHLDGSSFIWQGNETAILCIHGFTATTVEVRTIAKSLNSMGYTVAGPLLPGHGTSPEDLNTKTWRDWSAAAESAYLDLAKTYRNIFVLGESMGGLLALYLCSNYPEICGAMLFAPALKIPSIRLSNLIWPIKPVIFKKNIDETMPWQGYNVVPLKAISSLARFQNLIRKKLMEIRQPVLIFQGKKDKTINPLGSVEVLEKIGSSQKELIWLEESGHVILLGPQLAEVVELCYRFIEDLIPGKIKL